MKSQLQTNLESQCHEEFSSYAIISFMNIFYVTVFNYKYHFLVYVHVLVRDGLWMLNPFRFVSISQARFRNASALFMGFTFAITTSLGIAIGMGISTTYNENSPTALMVIGIFDSISAGILVYMALVDLIAADFLSKRMRSDRKLQIYAFVALFLGCGAMSIIGVWA